MVEWKSLIILKEFKKPNGNFLRVWAKNQWRLKCFDKILKFTYTNLNRKLTFFYFLSHLPGPLSFYTALENNTIFLQHFFGFGAGGSFPPPPHGRPCYWHLYTKMLAFREIWVLNYRHHINTQLSYLVIYNFAPNNPRTKLSSFGQSSEYQNDVEFKCLLKDTNSICISWKMWKLEENYKSEKGKCFPIS